MERGEKPVIRARKRPAQARSKQLVADVLEAAIRILRRDEGRRFTTVRVAEEAGVSVGSLYQYFPTKESLLFRLQADEWEDTWNLMAEILVDEALAPYERFRKAVVTFFRSEREEAPVRDALDRVGADFRESPEAEALQRRAEGTFAAFLGVAAPFVEERRRMFLARFFMTSMGEAAEAIAQPTRPRREVDEWANATADMYIAYLESLRTKVSRSSSRRSLTVAKSARSRS